MDHHQHQHPTHNVDDPEVALEMADDTPRPMRFNIKSSTLVHIAITLVTLVTIFTTLRADVEKLKTEQAKTQAADAEVRQKLDSIANKLDILNTRQMLFEQRVQELSDRFWEHQGGDRDPTVRKR